MLRHTQTEINFKLEEKRAQHTTQSPQQRGAGRLDSEAYSSALRSLQLPQITARMFLTG